MNVTYCAGEFMPENRQLLKGEELKEPNKLNDWKVRIAYID